MSENKPKLVIISGYFNPMHAGHLDMVEAGKAHGDKLVVIVNNDEQQKLKKGKVIQNQDDRHRIVQSLDQVDEAIIALDKDPTVVESIRYIAQKYPEHKIIFGNGGDRASTKDIPETKVCTDHDIDLVFGMGGNNKKDSSTRINDATGKDTIKKTQKRVIAFDLDGTLAESKMAIKDSMSGLLNQLLSVKDVLVISGGMLSQFENNLLSQIHASTEQLRRLHVMPTCGTKYYQYVDEKWRRQYNSDIPKEDTKNIIKVVEECAKELGFWESKTWGDIIEDRGSQVTFSALGQSAPAEHKYKWDQNGDKKEKLRDAIAPKIPEYEVRTGGTTSIDITLPGLDKAYGVSKLMESLGVSKEEILFIGDALHEGGNDYPVKAMGIDSIEVKDHLETEKIISTILALES